MLKLLGTLDILAGLLFVLLAFGFGVWRIPLLITIYVAVKCTAFRRDVWSWIDFGMGISSWFFFFNPSIFALIPLVYFIQKGVVSFF